MNFKVLVSTEPQNWSELLGNAGVHKAVSVRSSPSRTYGITTYSLEWSPRLE